MFKEIEETEEEREKRLQKEWEEEIELEERQQAEWLKAEAEREAEEKRRDDMEEEFGDIYNPLYDGEEEPEYEDCPKCKGHKTFRREFMTADIGFGEVDFGECENCGYKD